MAHPVAMNDVNSAKAADEDNRNLRNIIHFAFSALERIHCFGVNRAACPWPDALSDFVVRRARRVISSRRPTNFGATPLREVGPAGGRICGAGSYSLRMSGGAGRHGPGGVGAPFAPGSRVEAGAGEAGGFHGEEVVAGGDAGAALMHDVAGVPSLEQLAEFFPQHGGLFEASVGPQIVVEPAVGGAGDVAADRVEGLVFAAKAVRAAGIEEEPLGVTEMVDHVIQVHRQRLGRHDIGEGRGAGQLPGEGASGAAPSLEAPVQDGHPAMAEPAQ